METQFSILFYGKTSKIHSDGTIPIYLRITVGGERFETSTNRQIHPDKWSKLSGKALGNSEESKIINNYLETLRNKVFNDQREIIFEGKELSIRTIREKWIGAREKPRMLMEVFKEHNRQMKELIGKQYARLTYIRFETSLRHTQNFLNWKFQKDDIDIKKLDYYFISE